MVNTCSTYAAPAFLVGKKDGTKRLIFNFHRLNAQIEKVHFPFLYRLYQKPDTLTS